MSLRQLYHQWATSCALAPEDQHRILDYAFETSDKALITTLLRDHKCPDDIVARIRTSNVVSAVAAWLDSNHHNDDELAVYAETVDVELITAALLSRSGRMHGTRKFKRALWKRNNEALRVAICASLDTFDDPPKSWGTWLLAKRPFKTMPGTDRHIMETVILGSPEWAVNLAARSNDFRFMWWCYETLETDSHRRRDAHRSFFRPVIAYIADNDRDVAQFPYVLRVVDTMMSPSQNGKAPTPGSQEHLLVSDLVALAATMPKPTDDYVAEALSTLKASIGADDPEPAPATVPDMAAALAAGTVPANAVQYAADCYDSRSDELAQAVAAHPALSAADAVTMIKSQHSSWDRPEGLGTLFAGRSDEWLLEVTTTVIGDYRTSDHLIRKILDKAGYQVREAAILAAVTADMNAITKFVKLGTAPHSALGLVQAKKLSSYGKEVTAALYRLTKFRLGTDAAAWGVFEDIVDDFDGTYADLLDTTLRVIEVPDLVTA